MELILVTGFLGAGKTTFLQNLVALLAPRRLYLIVNEFGKTGVDGTLLQRVGAQLAQINNGSIFCACRLDKFEEELQRAIDTQPDVILVEASGLADPSSVRRVLENPRFAAIHYRGSICLADAARLHKVASTARVCPKQLAVSSLVLLNKTDLATPEESERARALIGGINPGAVVRLTTYGRLEKEWLADLRPEGGTGEATHRADITLQKARITVKPGVETATLTSFLKMFAEDTYRIKGFVPGAQGMLLVDCVGPLVQVRPYTGVASEPGRLVALAGPGMPLRKALKKAAEWYGESIEGLEL